MCHGLVDSWYIVSDGTNPVYEFPSFLCYRYGEEDPVHWLSPSEPECIGRLSRGGAGPSSPPEYSTTPVTYLSTSDEYGMLGLAGKEQLTQKGSAYGLLRLEVGGFDRILVQLSAAFCFPSLLVLQIFNDYHKIRSICKTITKYGVFAKLQPARPHPPFHDDITF